MSSLESDYPIKSEKNWYETDGMPGLEELLEAILECLRKKHLIVFMNSAVRFTFQNQPIFAFAK